MLRARADHHAEIALRDAANACCHVIDTADYVGQVATICSFLIVRLATHEVISILYCSGPRTVQN